MALASARRAYGRLVTVTWCLASLLLLGCRTIAPAGSRVLEDGNSGTAASDFVAAPPEGSHILVAYIPARYLPGAQVGATGDALAAIEIAGAIVRSVTRISQAAVDGATQTPGVHILRRAPDQPLAVLYPGMINLHNHTKQNVLPLWGEARGQFANRFEWRDWNNYTKAVSFNMNPWVADPAMTCAAFRWAELQAMVLGTTHLQGPSRCTGNFAIHQVEDKRAYPAEPGSELLAVQAPTDLVVPTDMPFVWKHLRPLIRDQGMTYEAALLVKIKEICPRLMDEFPISDVNAPDALDIFKDKERLISLCDGNPDKFIRFLNWQHKTVAGKKRYLSMPNRAAVVVHLAEGRRKDPYNRIEFEMMQLFGMDQKRVNLVHAVGVDAAGFKRMGERGMGLIWSPFSNLLLYGETVDIDAALAAGVPIALGSDWTPTGSRGVLEELKIARAYAEKMGLRAKLTDAALYEMVTENPARMLGHYESSPTDGRHGIGRIAPDAAASFVAMRRRGDDPYTNLVTAETADVDLVLVDGKPVYGELAILKSLQADAVIDKLPAHFEGLDTVLADAAVSTPIGPDVEAGARTSKISAIAKNPLVTGAVASSACGFEKGFVRRKSGLGLAGSFKAASGLDLDVPGDIAKLLAIGLVGQSYNRNPSDGQGDADFVVKRFPPMFSCDDAAYSKRFANFVVASGETESTDEMSQNISQRAQRRADTGLGNGPARLAEDYEQAYDPTIDY